MSGYADLDALFDAAAAQPTADVELPGGLVVKVRGLTRFELLKSVEGADGDATLVERRNVAACMVTPTMNLEQVEAWQRSSAPGVLGKVTDAIRKLSGLADGAAKSDLPGDGADGS